MKEITLILIIFLQLLTKYFAAAKLFMWILIITYVLVKIIELLPRIIKKYNNYKFRKKIEKLLKI